MKLDREKMNRLAALSDGELWCEIRKMAGGYGFKLPDAVPSHGELEKLRGIMTAEKINTAEALRLVNDYRRKHNI